MVHALRVFVVATVVFLAIVPLSLQAQGWGTVSGTLTDASTTEPIPGATVLVQGTNFGTAANANGIFALRLPVGRYLLRFSAIGYAAQTDSVIVVRDLTTIRDISLSQTRIDLEGVTIEAEELSSDAGVYRIDPREVQQIPSPFRDITRALKVVPGVATNNELSNQYSVRGGGFNENLLFVNGFEVFLPFRPRQGEQEGLSLLNPDLAEQITFYTGGFPARYGGKLSSALDVQYRTPSTGDPLVGAASVSLLDAALFASAPALNGRLGWTIGVRKAQARRFFETQELEGDYQPDYTDVQLALSYRINRIFSLEALGMLADHTFELDPSGRKTFFGTVSQDPRLAPSNLRSLWVSYAPGNAERDQNRTQFGGIRLNTRISDRLRVAHDLAYYGTEEEEVFTLSGRAILFQVDPGSSNPQGGEGLFPTGNVTSNEFADNRVAVETLTAQSRWMWSGLRHAAEAGISVRSLHFEDRLNEGASHTGPNTEGDIVTLQEDSLEDSATFNATQVGIYVQDVFDVLASSPGRLMVTSGLRADYFSFNSEWTVSPRLSARYTVNERVTLSGSWGVYFQAPTYREFRGKPDPGETILGAINRDLRAQESMQWVAGGTYFIPRTRLLFRAEAYYKRLRNLISYDIENVRVQYSGDNDAQGQTYGLDLQLRGEFVPGLESWINYSYLVAEENFTEPFKNAFNQGTLSRPTDQRHTLSLFVQDYITNDPTWKLHLRTLFGSGLPYTPPVPGDTLGTIIVQSPGLRFSARYPRYFRFDLGATKRITLFQPNQRQPVGLELTAEVLNVFNMVNTVAYTWVPDGNGIWTRIPTRLTPRTLNVRARIVF